MTFVPRWIHKYKDNPAYGRWVNPGDVFFGQFMNWIPIGADEALAVRGWGFDVVFTETKRELFFADPVAAKDARVARRIAEQEVRMRMLKGDVDADTDEAL